MPEVQTPPQPVAAKPAVAPVVPPKPPTPVAVVPPKPPKSEVEQLKDKIANLEARLAQYEDPRPAFQEFPKVVYLKDTHKLVANAEEEKKAKAQGYVNQPPVAK